MVVYSPRALLEVVFVSSRFAFFRYLLTDRLFLVAWLTRRALVRRNAGETKGEDEMRAPLVVLPMSQRHNIDIFFLLFYSNLRRGRHVCHRRVRRALPFFAEGFHQPRCQHIARAAESCGRKRSAFAQAMGLMAMITVGAGVLVLEGGSFDKGTIP